MKKYGMILAVALTALFAHGETVKTATQPWVRSYVATNTASLTPATNYTNEALGDFAQTNTILNAGPYLALTGGTMRIARGADGIVIRDPGLSLGGLPRTAWMGIGKLGVGPTMINLGMEISGEWFDVRHWAFPGILRIRLPTDGDEWKLNEDGYPVEGGTLALRSDLTQFVTISNVTEEVRRQSLGGIWDAQLQVWWTPIMENGALRYCATTNVNMEANQ